MKTVLILIIVIIVGIFVWNKLELKIPQINNSQKPSVINTKTIKEENIAKKYVIDSEYPEIAGLIDVSTQTLVNKKIKNQIDQIIAEFILNLPIENRLSNLPKDLKNSLFIRYNVAQANDKIISIEFDISDMKAGMAHPNNYSKVFNFDPVNNKEIIISDVFKTNSDYLNILSKYCREYLYINLEPQWFDIKNMIDEGTAPSENNFKNFTINKDSLTIIFDPYQVAPYAAGTQKIKIPFSELQGILSTKFQ